MNKYKVGDDCMWDHCSSIATCPCCEKDMLIAELEEMLFNPELLRKFIEQQIKAEALAEEEKP